MRVTYGWACHAKHVEVRGHLAGVGSLILFYPVKSQELTQIFIMAVMSGDEPHTTLMYLDVTLLFL